MKSLSVVAALFLLATAPASAQQNDRFKEIMGLMQAGPIAPFFRLDRYTGALEECTVVNVGPTLRCSSISGLPTDPGNTAEPEFDITILSPGTVNTFMVIGWYNMKTGYTAFCTFQRQCLVPK